MTIQLRVVIYLLLASILLPLATPTMAQTIPPTEPIVTEDFEAGEWGPKWRPRPEDAILLRVIENTARNGQVLEIDAIQEINRIRQADVARADEAYLTFWFNPNNVVIPQQDTNGEFISWPPTKSFVLAEILDEEEVVVAAIHLIKPENDNYQLFLRWQNLENKATYDIDEQTNLPRLIPIGSGWQKITLGFNVNERVSLWVDDQFRTEATGINNLAEFGATLHVGKANPTGDINPSGTILFDDITFAILKLDDIWVDAVNGADDNDGLTEETAFATIKRASDLAGPGTTVHILPGIYRESLWPAKGGDADNRVAYVAENGPGTVHLRGSESSNTLQWEPLQVNDVGLPNNINLNNIYYADLSAWNLTEAPRFVVQLDGQNQSDRTRLRLAREPDWEVQTEWKHHEFWWTADGGDTVASCYPPDQESQDDKESCDRLSRSKTKLTDRNLYPEPDYITEEGDLTTLGDLTGATIFALDTRTGHYMYQRTIDSHDQQAGTVTLVTANDGEEEAIFPGQDAARNLDRGLGWGSKYYVEGKPQLLDSPGEWWYDERTQRLYIWPPNGNSPATQNIEISRYDTAFYLTDLSYITLDGLHMEFYNENAINQENGAVSRSYENHLRNLTILYANRGIRLNQIADGAVGFRTDGFRLENSEVGHMDSGAFNLSYSWNEGLSDSASFPATTTEDVGIVNTVMISNTFHDLAFRNDTPQSDTAIGGSVVYANKFRFENNHVYNVAHNGIQFTMSVVQPDVTDTSNPEAYYDLQPHEVRVGNILVRGNLIEKACQIGSDCGGLKFWGRNYDTGTHVFRDVLIMENVFQENIGWSYVSGLRGLWTRGSVVGQGGRGFFADLSTGLHVYRNIAYNNTYMNYGMNGLWQYGQILFYNNIAADSLFGFRFDGTQFIDYGSVDTHVVNNIILNHERYGVEFLKLNEDLTNMVIDHNLYYNNTDANLGLFMRDAAQDTTRAYSSVDSLQRNTAWEDNGLDGEPRFEGTAPYECSYPLPCEPFQPRNGSPTINEGETTLPASLQNLLDEFGISDTEREGTAFDIGPYEYSFSGSIGDEKIYLPLIIKN